MRETDHKSEGKNENLKIYLVSFHLKIIHPYFYHHPSTTHPRPPPPPPGRLRDHARAWGRGTHDCCHANEQHGDSSREGSGTVQIQTMANHLPAHYTLRECAQVRIGLLRVKEG